MKTLGRTCLLEANLILVAGVTNTYRLRWLRRVTDKNGVTVVRPMDLTGWTPHMQVRRDGLTVIDLALAVGQLLPAIGQLCGGICQLLVSLGLGIVVFSPGIVQLGAGLVNDAVVPRLAPGLGNTLDRSLTASTVSR